VPVALGMVACSADAERERLLSTTRATYDSVNGRLRQITYDANKNGRVDTVTHFDGTRILRTEIDTDEDGRVDRIEFPGTDGALIRLEVSLKRDGRIDRWEHYEHGTVVRAEEDANGDGRPDKWEQYQGGRLSAVSLDNDADGRADRKLTYGAEGELSLIESNPDRNGVYQTRLDIHAQAER